nr:unnamed protein product [Spirometra erinaceieuropaei]
MGRQLHVDMMARDTDNGAVTEAFAVTNGVKQDCVLAPPPFSLIFSAILMDVYHDERPGIRIASSISGECTFSRVTRTAPTAVFMSTSPSLPTSSTNVDCPPEPPLPSSSSAVVPKSGAVASAMPINIMHTIPTHKQTATPPPPVLIAIAPSPHTSAWSVN